MRRMLRTVWTLENLVLAMFVGLLCVLARPVHAAKVPITWTLATQNTDNTPLTDLVATRLEWGSCVGGAFGISQASIIVKTPATSAAIFPTRLNPVCVRAFSRNAAGVESTPSGVLQVTLPGPLLKPISLGKPLILPPPH
jgi:hypothetical protein